MRQTRLRASNDSPTAFYHCLSRVVDRQFVLGDPEKAEFTRLMRLYEAFCEVRVITHCLMSNHFHILLEVPRRPADFTLSDEELLERLKPVNSVLEINTLRQRLQMLREAAQRNPEGNARAEAEALKATIMARMYDLSSFMKLLKGRFTQWYNRSHGRKGTLWEERFKSLLVEAAGDALTTMAAYIDLNPVRAGLVQDPKDYRWSGYGEANGGNAVAKAGLQEVCEANGSDMLADKLQSVDTLANYRRLVYQRGLEGAENEEGVPARRGFTEAEIAEVMEKKGRLSRLEMLHCRVRYFSDGAVMGSKEFLKKVFEAERQRFGPKRVKISHPMRGVEGGQLRFLRDLRVRVIG